MPESEGKERKAVSWFFFFCEKRQLIAVAGDVRALSVSALASELRGSQIEALSAR